MDVEVMSMVNLDLAMIINSLTLKLIRNNNVKSNKEGNGN
jgi:hypothetical protein